MVKHKRMGDSPKTNNKQTCSNEVYMNIKYKRSVKEKIKAFQWIESL